MQAYVEEGRNGERGISCLVRRMAVFEKELRIYLLSLLAWGISTCAEMRRAKQGFQGMVWQQSAYKRNHAVTLLSCMHRAYGRVAPWERLNCISAIPQQACFFKHTLTAPRTKPSFALKFELISILPQ
jgi:hypothetical protein